MSWELSNESSCEGKKVFLTWKQAQTHNNKLFKKGSPVRVKGKKLEKMHVYQCVKCTKYHIGHAKRKTNQPYLRKRNWASEMSE